MVVITKEEAAAMRKHFPDVHITILNKGHKYKRYYLEESIAVMAYLRKLREVPERVR